uniref:Uncharacterized protein n=1 Tax=Rhizophora mucronata TaxID=61149 RepID=A0A2P2PMF0_RHIMU
MALIPPTEYYVPYQQNYWSFNNVVHFYHLMYISMNHDIPMQTNVWKNIIHKLVQ